MRSPASRRMLFVIIISASAFFTLSIPLAEADPPEPRDAIAGELHAQQEAWNRGDIDSFMTGYARSETTVFVSGDDVTRGWQTVRDRYLKKYGDRAKMGALMFSDLEITVLSADSAVVLGRWELKRANDNPHGRFTLIFRKTAEGWQIVHDHTSAAAPQP